MPDPLLFLFRTLFSDTLSLTASAVRQLGREAEALAGALDEYMAEWDALPEHVKAEVRRLDA